MRAISLVAFDLDIMQVACILDDGEASMKLSIKLLVFPGFALVLAVAMLIMRKLGKRTTVDQYLNAIGNVALIMFVTLMLTVLLPFRCLPNPNGTEAMASCPSRLCWHGVNNIMAAWEASELSATRSASPVSARSAGGTRERTFGSMRAPAANLCKSSPLSVFSSTPR